MYHIRPVLDGDQFLHALAADTGIIGYFHVRSDAERVAELLEAAETPMPTDDRSPAPVAD